MTGSQRSVTVCNIIELRMVRNSDCRVRRSQAVNRQSNRRFADRRRPGYADRNRQFARCGGDTDARDTDLRTLRRNSLRADDPGTAGRLPLVDRNAWPVAGAEQDLGAESEA